MIDLEKFAGILQGTSEWDAARLGKATASRMADICATVKGGWAASRKNYVTELVLERIAGCKAENGFKSAAMERGNEIEAEARAAYAFQIGESVSQIAFVDHPTVAVFRREPGRAGGRQGPARAQVPELRHALRDACNPARSRPSTRSKCCGPSPAPAANGSITSPTIPAFRLIYSSTSSASRATAARSSSSRGWCVSSCAKSMPAWPP